MQQVNLYQLEFKPQKMMLDLQQLILGIIVLMAIFLALGSWLSSKRTALSEQVKQEEHMLTSMQTQVAQLEAIVTSGLKNGNVDKEIKNIEKEIQLKGLALNTLKTSDIASSGGFSLLLKGLAESKSDQLWFTDIELQNDVLKLKGQTMDPKLITYWIEEATKRSYLNRRFASVTITENRERPEIYNFVLAEGVVRTHE